LLPGNVPIAQYIEELLEGDVPFTVCYCDVDYFKPFNDTYGYSRGDMVIQSLAGILVAHCDPGQDFVGHIGGDDFVVVFCNTDWHERMSAVLDTFLAHRPRFYDDRHLEAGGIHSQDRRGNWDFTPLFSLSVGAVPIEPNKHVVTTQEIAMRATEAKAQAKRQDGNYLFTDRRGFPEKPSLAHESEN
jgi:GGDEF domain-containing protein